MVPQKPFHCQEMMLHIVSETTGFLNIALQQLHLFLLGRDLGLRQVEVFLEHRVFAYVNHHFQ